MFFPFYYLIGMNGNAIVSGTQTERGGLMFLLFQEFMIYATSFTIMVVASVETAEIGAVIALLLFTFSMVFCG
jgi:ABC-type multidrug transport system permease subunit